MVTLSLVLSKNIDLPKDTSLIEFLNSDSWKHLNKLINAGGFIIDDISIN